ncbi:MAG: hypothetical protein H0T69_01505 [Thermoleophilaceae bacterium]|nr:hypothetical protein [Thermoleophilaceae bacterium]
MKRLAIILILTLTSAAAVGVSPAGAGYTDPFAWKKCNQKVDFNLKITAASNMRCRGARSVMRRYDGSIARRFDAPSGFGCKLVKGRPISGIWRCSKKGKAFRFAFGD